ncbi:Pyrimidine monooxygenase RutA [Variovorax sp. PBS-H4]|nr:Pyrimidine monooxygenase RutA [Variovorax sp. PBS-H4]
MKSWRDDPRSETNPLFNSNRLKLGTFGTNGGGVAMTTAPEAARARWADCESAALAADACGIEAQVPFARWKGYVSEHPDHRSGQAFDCYTWAAAHAQMTKRSAIFATSHVPTIHPLMAAKQCATIDHISEGRFGLNVVAGWNKPELDMFGASMREHEGRYEQAAEWIEVLDKLWTHGEAFDFEGKFYRLSRAISMPRPLQAPRPPIMNAGTSEVGRHFAAKYADLAFVILTSEDPDQIRAQVRAYKELAAKEYGRDIQIWSYGFVIQRDTFAEAQRFFDYYVHEKGDEEAVEGWMKLQGMHAHILPAGQLEVLRSRFKAGGGGVPLMGTPDQITQKLSMLSACGVDGMLLSWLNYEDGIQRLAAEVLPRLVHAGLRQAAT